ncbi:hypothetical protein AGMMS49587_17300 [Spirochaetia bacterium]|nr:hypothetical protein AGMMS49587_17300 [Spirochaetia bacterium]
MKKGILCFIGMFALASGAFAVDFGLSAGGGFTFSGAFTKATTEMGNAAVYQQNSDQKGKDLNYGGFLFLDATYGEFYVSVAGGSGTLESTSTSVTPLGSTPLGADSGSPYTRKTSSLGIGLLGKYPFQIQKFTLFPLLGIEYQIFFSGEYPYDPTGTAGTGYPVATKAMDFSTLWFRVGAGGDYAITEALYVRLEALYGFKLAKNGFDKNNTAFVEGGGPGGALVTGEVKKGWVNTVTVKLGVGYKFM